MDVRIRPAVADDAAFLAWVIFAAGRSHCSRGIWDVILGWPEDVCLSYLERLVVTETRHPFHYSGFIVAEADGRPAAALSGYYPKQLGFGELALGMQEVFGAVDWSKWERADNRKGLAAIIHCLPDYEDGEWVVESVATVPQFRRQGIIHGMLRDILVKGREMGFDRGQVSVFIGNTAAQRAYEKSGFTVVGEKRHPDFEAEIGSPGMAHLRCPL